MCNFSYVDNGTGAGKLSSKSMCTFSNSIYSLLFYAIKLLMYLLFMWGGTKWLWCGQHQFWGPNSEMGPENRDFLGPNSTRFARCHFSAPKSQDFQGPPLTMARVLDVACIKINSSQLNLNNRYIGNFKYMRFQASGNKNSIQIFLNDDIYSSKL